MHVVKNSAKLYKLSEVPLVTLVGGAKSHSTTTEKVMVSFIEMDSNAVFPLHKHRSEQVMIVLEGSIRQNIAGEELTLNNGDILTIRSNLIHGGKASKEECKAIDIFSPPRADYLELIETKARSFKRFLNGCSKAHLF